MGAEKERERNINLLFHLFIHWLTLECAESLTLVD